MHAGVYLECICAKVVRNNARARKLAETLAARVRLRRRVAYRRSDTARV